MVLIQAKPQMITLSDSAQDHFAKLVAQQGIDGLGIRLTAVHAGTPKGDCQLEFCEPADLDGTEWEIECREFSLYVDSASRPFLDGATIDFDKSPTGGALTIRAPGLSSACSSWIIASGASTFARKTSTSASSG